VQPLAEDAHVPAPFLAKVLQDLAGKGILRSKRGRAGGFVLGRPASEITMADVILALEGKDDLDGVFPALQGIAGTLLEPSRQRFFDVLRSTSVEAMSLLAPAAELVPR
jgi:Rrf2 family protein